MTLNNPQYRGIVTFVSDEFETQQMHLFTATSFSGGLVTDCEEGVLDWIDKKELRNLPIWEGDKIFLRLIDTDAPFFSLKLVYEKDKLIEHKLEM